jgi:hypothetical protein
MQEQGAGHIVPQLDSSASAEVQACSIRMQQMINQQEALQQQNQDLYGKLHELQEELTKRLDSLSSATLLPPPPEHQQTPQAEDTASSSATREHPSPTPVFSRAQCQTLPARSDVQGNRHQFATQCQTVLAATDAHGSGHHISDAQHAGTPCSHQQTSSINQPSRGLLALMYEAGHQPFLTKALPAILPKPQLCLEASDIRTVNSVRLQFLGVVLRHTFREPPPPSEIFMRFRFFNFSPTQTAAYRLEPLQVRLCTSSSLTT